MRRTSPTVPSHVRPWLVALAAVGMTLPGLVLGAGLVAADPSEGGAPVVVVAHYASRAQVPSDARLREHGFEPLYRFAAIPAVVAEGPEGWLERLASDPGFSGVERDRPLEYLMQTATFATRAADVWGEAWWPTPGDVDRVEPSPLLDANGDPIDGRGVTVGVVDSGIDATHPDLWYAPAHADQMPWEPKVKACVQTGVGNLAPDHPYCDETVGHGTHVAGIVAGNAWAARNGLTPTVSRTRPPVGAAPGASLVGAGLGAGLSIINAAAGLDWMYQHAEEHGIRVVTNSWGDPQACNGQFPNDSITLVTNRLVNDKGVVVLFAAGNYDNFGNPTWTSPYSSNPTPGVVTVANYDDRGSGTRAGAINPGSSDGCVKPAAGGDYVWTWPDVAAPGTSILSTMAKTGTVTYLGPTAPPFYATIGGTSMATPHVAGIAALMLQANPALTPAQVERILIETATPYADGVAARGVSGTAMWGPNDAATGFADKEACRVTPTDAAKAEAGDASVDAKLPGFTLLAQRTDADLFVCRDFKRGAGLVDAYAAVRRALALAGDDGSAGGPVVTVDSPAEGAAVAPGPLEVRGNVSRTAGSANAPPTATLSATPRSGPAPLEVEFTLQGADADGVVASWAFDADSDGAPEASGPGPLSPTLVRHAYPANGSHVATLTVVDDAGANATATVAVSVGGLPVPDGAIEGETFAYNAGGAGASNVLALATGATLGDQVPKYPAGSDVSLQLRSARSVDPAVVIDEATPAELLLLAADGAVAAGPLPMTGSADGGVGGVGSGGYSYSAGTFTIPLSWNGRYYLAPRLTVDGVERWVRSPTFDGLKPIDVVGLPGGAGPSDAAHAIGDADDDGGAPTTEIQWADVAVTDAEVVVATKLARLQPVAAGDSPFVYGVEVNGRRFETYVLVGVSLWDATGAQDPGGSATWDAGASVVRVSIPRAYLAQLGDDCPCEVAVASYLGEGLLGGLVQQDRAPDAGAVRLALAAPLGSSSDPEATDGVGDAPAPFLDVQALWIDGAGPATFDVVMKVEDLLSQPPSADVGVAKLAVAYGAEFCLDNNVNRASPEGLFCYRLGAVNGLLGPTFSASVIQQDGTGSCALDDALDGGAFQVAAGTIRWTLRRAALDVTENGAGVQACNVAPPARGGAGVVDGTTLSLLQGTTGVSAGAGVILTLNGLDSTDPAQARPYVFDGTTQPLAVDAGGPYAGAVGSAIPVQASVTGGRAPHACAWSGPNATFGDPAACATTATFATAGVHAIRVDATDAEGAASGDDAQVQVGAAPAGERVELWLDQEASPRASVPVQTGAGAPTAAWNATIDLTGLSGARLVVARWIGADGALLAQASVNVTLTQESGAAFVVVDEPADDPSGATPVRGTVPVAGRAGHAGGAPSGAALAANGLPLPSRLAPRAGTQEGGILVFCGGCQPQPLGPASSPGDLATSLAWVHGPESDYQGFDGHWFAIPGAGGSAYLLDDATGQTHDVRFFNDWRDLQADELGANNSVWMPKAGTVPPGANWAFVYMRRPTQNAPDAVLGAPTLAITPQATPPTAPQDLVAVPGARSVHLSWQAPADDGGGLGGYHLYRDGALAAALGPEATSHTDGGREPGVAHAYALRAHNAAGEGPAATATAAALDEGAGDGLAVTSPAHGAQGVPADAAIAGTYAPRANATNATSPGDGPFANTHYLFLMNLNNGQCAPDLGYGDVVIASRLVAHARERLGVPDANVHFFNEAGGPLCPAADPAHHAMLPPEWQAPNNPFDGKAQLAPFAERLALVARQAADAEAAGGAPARVFIMHSSHGFYSVGLEHRTASSMSLYQESVHDRRLGDAITAALDDAEAAANVSIEVAILVDCSFCGGFADSPLWIPGTTTTSVDTANVVGRNRVVEVGCTWITECFGNPAVTYDHMFNECAFTGRADGWGPALETGMQGHPAPDGTDDPGQDVVVPREDHHAKDGLVTLEESYWCALDSVKGVLGSGGTFVDPIGIQQMFQLVDQMGADLFGGDGFALWAADSALDVPSLDPSQPLPPRAPLPRAAAVDPSGDALTPYGDLVAIEATATATHVVVDLDVADLSLSAQRAEDVVSYDVHVNGARFEACYSLGAPTVYSYAAGANVGTATYDFARGRVHVEIPREALPDGALPAQVHAQSRHGACSAHTPLLDDRLPDEGAIATSEADQPVVDAGRDAVRVRLDGPDGAAIQGEALLNETARAWTFRPATPLAEGVWSATAEHFFDDGSGPVKVDGPVAVSFTVGSPADATPPGAPGDLRATDATATSVTLAWSAATDDVGVARYRVHRATAPGVAATDATLVGETNATGFTDAGLAPNATYHYVVVAEDAAGNRGPASNEANATTLPLATAQEVVRLHLDGAPTPFATIPVDSTATGEAAWRVDLDTTALADGFHVVRAVYDDGAGGSAQDEATFLVQNDLGIEILSPAEGATVERPFTVSGATSGTGGPAASAPASFLRPDATARAGAPALDVIGTAALDPLAAALAQAQGFLALAPDAGGARELVAHFSGEAPADLRADLAPPGWSVRAVEHVALERAVRRVLEVVERDPARAREGPPLPAQAAGIGPGSHLLMTMKDSPGSTFACTANFVWEDLDTGRLYLGAAGHCFLPGTKVATHGAGADYDPSRTSVKVCVAACSFGGQLGFSFQGTTRALGAVAYARQTGPGGDVGNDFGLVEIPDALRHLVRPEMPVWNGPVAEGTLQIGEPAVLYGNAGGFGEVWPTMARAGVGGVFGSANHWTAVLPSFQGDSGSALLSGVFTGDDDLLVGHEAVGALTHLSALGPVAGTTMTRAKAMAREAGIEARPVLAGEDVTQPSAPAAPEGLVASPRENAVELAWSAPYDGGSPITGYTIRYGTSPGARDFSQAASGTNATVAGLANGVAYHFVVTATNAAGEGPASNEATATPVAGAGVPDAPTGLLATPGNGRVSLAWNAPASDGGSPITHYTVRHGTAPGAYDAMTTVGGTSALVTGLTNGVTYFFAVSAGNAQGEGPLSEEAAATPAPGNVTAYAVELRLLTTEGAVVPGFDWAPADAYDGSSWTRAFEGVDPGAYVAQARLLQSGAERARDAVTLTAGNRAPIADAGPDADANEGQTVQLQGAVSDPDGDAVALAWTAPEGVTLQGADTATPTFVAPQVDGPTRLVFRLDATDAHGLAATDEVAVTVHDLDEFAITSVGGTPPDELDAPVKGVVDVEGVARLSPQATPLRLAPLAHISDLRVDGLSVTASARGSLDPDGEIVHYAWDLGDGVARAGPELAHAFAAPGLHRVTLRVTDAHGLVSTASVPVLALDASAPAAETYYLHRASCGHPLTMDRAPAPAREGGQGCIAATRAAMDATWTATEATGVAYPSGSLVMAHVRGYTARPEVGVRMAGTLLADGVAVATGTATADSLSVIVALPACAEWTIPMTTLAAIPEGATLSFRATTDAGTGDVSVCYEGGAAASRIALSAAGGAAEPTATILVPEEGAALDAAATPVVEVSGGATFPGVETAQRAYLRRDACANLDADPMYLSPEDAPDAGNGCALTAGAAAPAQDFVERYPLVASELPITLSPGGRVTGRVFFGTQGADPAQVELRLVVDGEIAGAQVADVLSASVLGIPEAGYVDVSIPVGAAAAGRSAAALAFEIKILRQGAIHWTSLDDPASYVNLPRHEDPQGRIVQVSVDDPTFASGLLVVEGDEAWRASWSLAGLSGAHTLYARAGTQDGFGPAASRNVLVLGGAPARVPRVEVQVVPAGAPVAQGGWSNATALDVAAGEWRHSWNTTALANGRYDFHARLVSEGEGEVARDAFTASVGNPRPPAFERVPDRSVRQGETARFQVRATDPDGDPVALAAADLPPGATFDAATGEFAWTPPYDLTGAATAVFDATDGALRATLAVRLDVVPVQRAPVLAPVGGRLVVEEQTLAFLVRATDENGDALRLAAHPLPRGASFADHGDGTGTFSWTPDALQQGDYDVEVRASDGHALAKERVTLRVADAQGGPALVPMEDAAVAEGQELVLYVNGRDPDGDPLRYAVEGLPKGARFDAATRRFAWTPAHDQAGVHAVAFTATDGNATARETLNVTVLDVNRAPEPAAGSAKADAKVHRALAHQVRVRDPDGDALAFSAEGLPAGAALDAETGVLTWRPAAGQEGAHDVTIVATDGMLEARVPLRLLVTPNEAPLLAARVVGAADAGAPADLAANATDPDGALAPLVEWDFDPADGFQADATGANATRVFAAPGAYDVAVRATDADGVAVTKVLRVVVDDALALALDALPERAGVRDEVPAEARLAWTGGAPVAGAEVKVRVWWQPLGGERTLVRTLALATGEDGAVAFRVPLDAPLGNHPGRHVLEAVARVPASLNGDAEAAAATDAYEVRA